MIKTIGFDADDTLWHNERIFLSSKEKYKNLLSNYHDSDWIEERLDATEIRNIQHFGYGVKGFTLSMIETAIDLTEGRVSGGEIEQIIGFAKEMLDSPIDVLDGVGETIAELANDFDLMLITKGDLFDQETKIARSNLGEYFGSVEIVSEKSRNVYNRIISEKGLDPSEFVMVGNSLKSDIVPVVEIGSNAVHIPYETEWAHDKADDDYLAMLDFAALEKIAELPEWLKSFTG